MLKRILRVAGIELVKLRSRPAAWALLALVVLATLGQAAVTALSVEAQHDRTRELNAWLVFAAASDTGLFLASLLLVLLASAALAGETSMGTLTGLLLRPVTRTDLVLGKFAALLAVAGALAAAVLGTAAAVGAALSDYTGVRTVAHNERETGLLAEAADPAAPGPADLRRLGLTGRWDEAFGALRIGQVRTGSLAEARQIQPGDLVTHAAAGTAPLARLGSADDWRRLADSLQEGDPVRLRLDSPLVTENRDFTGPYLAGQALRAILMIPLPLLAAIGFGLLGSALVDGAAAAVGGTLLLFLALRTVAAPVGVSLARLVGATGVFAADVERFLFTSWLAAPLARLQGAATATANLEIRDAHLIWSAGVCASTAALALALVLWRVNRRDVL